MWNFDDVSSILTCDNNSSVFAYVGTLPIIVILMFAPMKIQMSWYICIKNFSKQRRKTMEHKSCLILIINSYVSVWGQSVYICCSIAASKPFASEWSQTTLYGWKKQFWKTYISVSQRSVPNTAMIINSSVQKISSFWVFWFIKFEFYFVCNCWANYLEIIFTCVWRFMSSIYPVHNKCCLLLYQLLSITNYFFLYLL